MKNTRFMERLFSAVEAQEEKVVNQVDSDIRSAEADGEFKDEENGLDYVALGEGKVLVTDKENGEQTVVERVEDGLYDLSIPEEELPTEQIEGYAHPEEDGVTPAADVEGAADEHVEEHLTGEDVIAPNQPDGGLNPEAGHEKSVEETAQEGPQEAEEEPAKEEEIPAEKKEEEEVCPKCGKNPCECEKEKEFSVNTVIARIVNDQVFMERLFSEVIESEKTTEIGDLKIEKVPEENAVVVTDESTGDQAKVEYDGEDINVSELEEKKFNEEEEKVEEEPASCEEPEVIHVVGIDTINNQLIDSPEIGEENAQDLVDRLTEVGVEGVQTFDDEQSARDYAIELLGNAGVDIESEDAVEEPVQAEFSDHTVYCTRYFSAVEDEIPSDVVCNLAQTKFFSIHEEKTAYMERLFSDEASIDEIEDAIKDGNQIENEKEIITPVDDTTAVIEDKDNGEFTKAVIEEATIDVTPITEEEATELTKDLEVEKVAEDEKEEEEDEKHEEEEEKHEEEEEKHEEEKEEEVKEEEKKFSIDNIMTKFFAEAGFVAPAAPESTTQEVKLAPGQSVVIVDENGQPVEQPAEEVAAPSVEAIEDKALAAVNAIQAAAAQAEATILDAKAAPADANQEPDLKEASFSNVAEKKFSDQNDTLVSWLNGTKH